MPNKSRRIKVTIIKFSSLKDLRVSRLKQATSLEMGKPMVTKPKLVIMMARVVCLEINHQLNQFIK